MSNESFTYTNAFVLLVSSFNHWNQDFTVRSYTETQPIADFADLVFNLNHLPFTEVTINNLNMFSHVS